MTREEFWKYYNDKEFEKLRAVFDAGGETEFGFNIDTYTKQASWSEDFNQLYFLWQNGAKASTPYIVEIFERFTKGETAQDLIKEKEIEKKEKQKKVKANLTEYQNVRQLPIDRVYFNKNEKNETYLMVKFAPFIYQGEVFDSESCLFGPLDFSDLESKNKFDFSSKVFDESIYLFNAHNPVNLLEIEFKNILKNEIEVKVTLQFNFEFEGNGKNELMTIETIAHSKMFM